MYCCLGKGTQALSSKLPESVQYDTLYTPVEMVFSLKCITGLFIQQDFYLPKMCEAQHLIPNTGGGGPNKQKAKVRRHLYYFIIFQWSWGLNRGSHVCKVDNSITELHRNT